MCDQFLAQASDWLMVRYQGSVTGVNIINAQVPGCLRLCALGHQVVNIFLVEGSHICKTTLEMCIRYSSVGTSKRTYSRGYGGGVNP